MPLRCCRSSSTVGVVVALLAIVTVQAINSRGGQHSTAANNNNNNNNNSKESSLIGNDNEDACRPIQNCRECLATQTCGWCSSPLRDLNGTWTSGVHCARFVDYGNSLLCFDEFSTTSCKVAYSCSNTSEECVATEDGGLGMSWSHCNGTCGCDDVNPGGCGMYTCVNDANDMFGCVYDPEHGTQTFSDCSNTCGVGAATPIPTAGNCTPPCIVPCDPKEDTCCPHSKCGFDFVWNDYRCHPDGLIC